MVIKLPNSTCRGLSVTAKSPLEAMAAAVEDACVVLIAASRKYKDSESCRTGECLVRTGE